MKVKIRITIGGLAIIPRGANNPLFSFVTIHHTRSRHLDRIRILLNRLLYPGLRGTNKLLSLPQKFIETVGEDRSSIAGKIVEHGCPNLATCCARLLAM